MKYILIALSVLVLFSCHRCKTKSLSPEQKIEKIAQQKYHEKYTLQWNETKDYVFIQKKKAINHSPFPTISFAVYDSRTQKLLFEDTVPGGQIKWLTNDIIEVYSLVGRPKDIHTNKKKPLYRYNVKKHTKTK